MERKEITKAFLRGENCDTCIYKYKARYNGIDCSCPEFICEKYLMTAEISWKQLNGREHHGFVIDAEDDAFYVWCDIHKKECSISR